MRDIRIIEHPIRLQNHTRSRGAEIRGLDRNTTFTGRARHAIHCMKCRVSTITEKMSTAKHMEYETKTKVWALIFELFGQSSSVRDQPTRNGGTLLRLKITRTVPSMLQKMQSRKTLFPYFYLLALRNSAVVESLRADTLFMTCVKRDHLTSKVQIHRRKRENI
jgi:hypothetical protein